MISRVVGVRPLGINRRVLGSALLVGGATIALVVLIMGSTYTQRKERGWYLTDQINQVRSPTNLANKYLLDKVADARAEVRVDEYNRTGSAEFGHNLNPVIAAMNDAGWCWKNVGEVIGYSSRVARSAGLAYTADKIIDLWQNSPTHWSLINGSAYNWGGGSWARVDSGNMMFFIYYVVDPC